MDNQHQPQDSQKQDSLSMDELIKDRTKEYSQHTETREVRGELKNFLKFRFGSECYAMEMLYMNEVLKSKRISCIPRQKDFVKGVVNVRGEIVMIVDLKSLLNITSETQGSESRMILLKRNSELSGFIADEVFGTEQMDTEDFQSSLATFKGGSAEFIAGLCTREGQNLIWLDAEKILTEIARRLQS